jgi:hypothetical protein
MNDLELAQAVMDWNTSVAYFDGHNFRVRSGPGERGPIASWNKAVKRRFEGTDAGIAGGLHLFAGWCGWTEMPVTPATRLTLIQGGLV